MTKHDEEVSKLERDLRFFPVKNEHPRKLTGAQIEFLNRDGYLSGFRVFDAHGVTVNRQNFDRILQFPYIAGPRVDHQPMERGRREPFHILVCALYALLEEVLRQ